MKKQKEAVHFIAIGGIGMSALATVMLKMGYRVSGSDMRRTWITNDLQTDGAQVAIGHDAINIPADCDEVIYSSAIREDNVEFVAARERGIPIVHRGELLARFFNGGHGVAVAGAHGKTTTSAMIALIYRMMNKSPNIILGGVLPQIDCNAEKGESDIWVVEADESDGSFLKLQPQTTVITNIEPEHMEYYGTLHQLHRSFAQFVDASKAAVLCYDDPLTKELSQKSQVNIYSYGLQDPDAELTARDIRYHQLQSSCKVVYRGETVGEMVLKVPGVHNVSNALAAAYAAYLDGIPFADSIRCLASFTGTGRRFEKLYQDQDMVLIDDYAHHPTEVQATIAAAKDGSFQRIVVVFQPHRYSRVRDLYREFGASFGEADVVAIDEIYSAWEDPCPGITSQLIVDEIKGHGIEPHYLQGRDKILAWLQKECGAGDLILMMGAGDIRKTAEAYRDYLNAQR